MGGWVSGCVHACVRARVRARLRACVRARALVMCVCVRARARKRRQEANVRVIQQLLLHHHGKKNVERPKNGGKGKVDACPPPSRPEPCRLNAGSMLVTPPWGRDLRVDACPSKGGKHRRGASIEGGHASRGASIDAAFDRHSPEWYLGAALGRRLARLGGLSTNESARTNAPQTASRRCTARRRARSSGNIK